MRLTKFRHACVRLEWDGAVLVVDPGEFTEPEALDGADAVLITHEHFDHLDVDRLTAAAARGQDLTVYTHPDVVAKLSALGDSVRAVTAGDAFTAAGFRVRAYGELHALAHPQVPRIANVGFLIEDSIYHPGDSLEPPAGARVETLLLPIMAPWTKLSETADYARLVAPRRAYPVHDHLLSEAGLKVYNGAVSGLVGCEYTYLSPRSSVEL